jgi:hypothetical protein
MIRIIGCDGEIEMLPRRLKSFNRCFPSIGVIHIQHEVARQPGDRSALLIILKSEVDTPVFGTVQLL